MNSTVITVVRKNIRQSLRDPITFFIGLLPVALAILFRFMIPFITGLFRPWIDLSGLENFWAGLLILIGPMMFGMVGGFLFLDEKDQNLLPVLKVTPMSDSFWILEKTILPVIITVPGILLQLLLCGLVSPFNWRYIPLGIIAALEAPLLTMFMATFAKDKVQGMTMAKAVSIIMMPPLLTIFINHPLIHLTAVSPPYWILTAFRYSAEGGIRFWLTITGGGLYHILLGYFLFRLSRKNFN